MSGIEMLGDLLPQPDRDGGVYGVVVGVVTNNKDPDGLGRVKLKFPWLSDSDESHWARVMTPMAGNDRGLYFLPEVDDEVLVVFLHGRVDHPYVLGALWNGQDKPPADNKDGKNNLRVLRSRSGHTITLDDTKDAEKITIRDKSGKDEIVLDAKANTVSITAGKDLTVKSDGGMSFSTEKGAIAIKCKSFTLDAEESYEIKAQKEGKLKAQTVLTIDCSAGVNVNSGALEVK